MAFTPAERQRAFRIENKLKTKSFQIDDLDDDDRVFILDYRDRNAQAVRANASEEILTTHVERRSMAAEAGTVESFADYGAAALSREEGKRLDNLTQVVIEGLKTCIGEIRTMSQIAIKAHQDAADTYRAQSKDLLERSKQQDGSIVELQGAVAGVLEACREHLIARAQAEATMASMQIQQQGPPTEMQEFMDMLKMAKDLGVIPKEGLSAVAGKKGDSKEPTKDAPDTQAATEMRDLLAQLRDVLAKAKAKSETPETTGETAAAPPAPRPPA